MPAALLVAPNAFGAAAGLVGDDATATVRRAVAAMQDGLAACGGMAGSDESGQAWGESYDEATAAAFAAIADLLVACNRIAALLDQSGINYAAADDPHGPAVAPTTRFTQRVVGPLEVPPSAVDRTPTIWGGPPGWTFVADIVGHLWPDGHQDRLHAAADAWRLARTTLSETASCFELAAALVAEQELPETADALAVLTTLCEQAGALGDRFGRIGAACDTFAHHLDVAHSAAIHELAELINETFACEMVGGVLTGITFGLSELAANGVEFGFVVRCAFRVRDILEVLIGAARAVALEIQLATADLMVTARLAALLGERAVTPAQDLIHLRLGEFAGGRLIPARLAPDDRAAITGTGTSVESVQGLVIHVSSAERDLKQARDVPVSTNDRSLDHGYKHAPVLGVTLPKGRAGFTAYDSAIRAFVADKETIRTMGRFRNQRAVLNYQIDSRIVLVQRPDGAFVSTFVMSRRQFENVIGRRMLGGG